GNKDDHSKNFSFMLTRDNVWKMTPAYDLTPSEGINGEQTAMVNGKGKEITNEDFIKTAEPFGFDVKKVSEIIEQIDNALSVYQKYAKQLGIK
ncbi:MAG: HipA domain-containing protein, partial [Alphaproteobacteria bacterium]|nr:HipA domain-containing protein [Alphaproteobacteria bacterium]